jgi:hypothetical protein
MKVFTVLLALVLSAPCFAQSIDTNSGANSNSGSSSDAGAFSTNTVNFEGTQVPSTTKVRNTPGIGLAATTNSFSSDYCGGTVQAGGSGPGISIGFSKQAYDTNCQALRRSEKFGQLSVTAYNFKNFEQARALLSMSIFEVCHLDTETQDACLALNLVKIPKE